MLQYNLPHLNGYMFRLFIVLKTWLMVLFGRPWIQGNLIWKTWRLISYPLFLHSSHFLLFTIINMPIMFKCDLQHHILQIAKSLPRIIFFSGLSGEEMMMFIDAFPETGILHFYPYWSLCLHSPPPLPLKYLCPVYIFGYSYGCMILQMLEKTNKSLNMCRIHSVESKQHKLQLNSILHGHIFGLIWKYNSPNMKKNLKKKLCQDSGLKLSDIAMVAYICMQD